PGLDVVGRALRWSGPGDATSAPSVSFAPGHLSVMLPPQASFILSLSMYLPESSSSMLLGQLGVSIMYWVTASRTDLTRSLVVEICAFLNLLNNATPTPPAIMAMIARTIMISSSVKPACLRRARRCLRSYSIISSWVMIGSSLDHVLHFENGLKD